MIYLLSPQSAWQALQGLTGRHRGGIIVTMIDESQCRTSDALPNSLATPLCACGSLVSLSCVGGLVVVLE